jgi:hypothetical protein
MSKKIAVIIVLAIVAIALFGLWALNKSKMYKPGKQEQNNTQTPAEVKPVLPFTKEETPVEKLPEGFVAGFPLEKDAIVVSNYSAKTASGLQSSRRFVSKKTLDENYKIYNDYFTKNKWTILTSVDTPAFKSISAESPAKITATISVSTNSATNNVEVDIGFLQPIK